MNEKHRIRLSKFLSRHLRHVPEDLGLTLEPGGWVAVDALLAACATHGQSLTRSELDEIVSTSDKQRYSFDENASRIRANQGHSVEIDLHLEPAVPPDVLFHGTAESVLPLILRDGLLKMRRHHVHLSAEVETAWTVGARHGKPVVLALAAGKMASDGATFFVSDNGVWLVEHVPPQYLTTHPRS